jgi:hypothetical protein
LFDVPGHAEGHDDALRDFAKAPKVIISDNHNHRQTWLGPYGSPSLTRVVLMLAAMPAAGKIYFGTIMFVKVTVSRESAH